LRIPTGFLESADPVEDRILLYLVRVSCRLVEDVWPALRPGVAHSVRVAAMMISNIAYRRVVCVYDLATGPVSDKVQRDLLMGNDTNV
jgi:hypothetical protein